MKQIPEIQKYMTPMPHSINPEQSLKKAHDMMRELGIRHLPVQTGGELVGILTDRDIKLASSFKGSESLTVSEAMSPDPYCVEPSTPLTNVLVEMTKHKLGCTLVRQSNGKLVGIFTAIDGLSAFHEVLQARFRN